MIPSTPVAKPPRAVVVPQWIAVALGEVGVVEDTRPGMSNPRIEQYHAITSAGTAADDVSWCSSFTSWSLEMAGVKSTRSKTAASYLTWGEPCDLKFGCVVLMAKSDADAGGSGHVGFYLGSFGDSFFLLGGNQSQRVDIGVRKLANIVAKRWPAMPKAA